MIIILHLRSLLGDKTVTDRDGISVLDKNL